MKYYLGIDLGTTGTKTLLFDQNGKVLGKGYKGYDLITPCENFYEQSPNDWYDAVVESVKLAVCGFDGQITALSVSSQGGSFVFCDVDNNNNLIPLTNAITWLDKRAEVEANEINEKVYKITGEYTHGASAISKILWVKKHEPQIFNQTKLILSTSDYIYYLLTGNAVIDTTSASMMDVFDNKNLVWNNDLLSIISLTTSNLAKIVTAGDFIGKANSKFLTDTGIIGEVSVYAGLHDQFAASLANTYFNENDLIISTGTTWVAFIRNKDKKCGPFFIRKHPDGGYAYFISAISSGTVLEWTKNNYNIDYKEMDELAKNCKIDENLLVYPFISGNGSYRGKNNLTYSVEGATFKHSKGDVFKATMEGVAFEIKQIYNIFLEKGFNIGNVIVTGGATRSDVWMAILSDVLNKPLYLSKNADGCCFGAYSVAKKGFSGNYAKFEFDGKIVTPNLENAKIYDKKFTKYNQNLKYKGEHYGTLR